MKKNFIITLSIFVTIWFLNRVEIMAQPDSLVNITSRDEQSLTLKISNKIQQSKNGMIVVRISGTKMIMPDSLKKYKSGLKFDNTDSATCTGIGNKIVYKTGDKDATIKIEKLKADTTYMLDFYDNFKHLLSYSVQTLAVEPASNISRIYWSGTYEDRFNLLFSEGSGKGRVVFLTESNNMLRPVDGKTYKGNAKFSKGDSLSIGSVCYCVLGNADSNFASVAVTNLKPGRKYIIAVYDFNGSGLSTNYNQDTTHLKNIIPLYTLPVVPEIQKPIFSSKGKSLELSWKKSEGATTYVFDIAKDIEFNELLEYYTQVDVGDVDNFLIDDIDVSDVYYMRIRAVGQAGSTAYSKPYKINVK